MSKYKTRAPQLGSWELRPVKLRKPPRAMTGADFRREAKMAIEDVKKRTKGMSGSDGKKLLRLVYWMMADECGLIPHDAMTEDPLKEQPAEDPRLRWAEKLTIEFGKHKGTLVKDLPNWYVDWLLGEENSFFREVQDAIRILRRCR